MFLIGFEIHDIKYWYLLFAISNILLHKHSIYPPIGCPFRAWVQLSLDQKSTKNNTQKVWRQRAGSNIVFLSCLIFMCNEPFDIYFFLKQDWVNICILVLCTVHGMTQQRPGHAGSVFDTHVKYTRFITLHRAGVRTIWFWRKCSSQLNGFSRCMCGLKVQAF